MPKRFKTRFLSLFRELFLYHSSSLEFRAKVLSVVIAANSAHGGCEQEVLKDIAYATYKDDANRAEILIAAVNEYLQKITDNSSQLFNTLIEDIQKESKLIKRYKDKIDIAQLQKFQNCTHEEDDKIYQLRVLEFLEGVKR
jgi:hypothetical protein